MTSQQLVLELTSDSVFDHVRSTDGELVGYIAITDEGEFLPFDLLHRQVAPAGELSDAEALLESIGLTSLSQAYLVERDAQTYRVGIKELTREQVTVGPISGDIDPTKEQVDLTHRWSYPLPAPQLRPE